MENKLYVFDEEKDWLKARESLFTSSEMIRLMGDAEREMTESELVEYKKINPKSRKKSIVIEDMLSDGAITYVLEVCANIEAEPQPMYYNAEMMWGKDTEPEAALELCNQLGLDVNSNDVIYTSHGGLVFFSNGKSGGTPDQIFYGLKAISEIKCPKSATHLYYKRFVNSENFQSELPKYYDQIQHNLFLTGMDKAYFFSFDPRFKKKNLQSHIIEIPKDQDRIDLMVKKINAANELKNSIINN